MITTTIDLLRHGEAAGGPCFRGSTDHPLTAYGRQQMKQAVSGAHVWTRIISSPLRRCLDFAMAFSRELELPLHIEPRLQEIYFGDWEGKNADEIEQLWPMQLDHFYQDPVAYPPNNGEDFTAFRQRIKEAWSDIITTNRGQRLLIITHAGVIRALFCLFLDINNAQNSFHIQLNHACLSRFQVFHAENSDFVQLISHHQL